MARPTIPDVAAAAGVSVATVNRVLGDAGRVRPDTRQRVLEAARRIGFHGSGAIAQRLDAARPRWRLGVLIQTAHRPFSNAVVQGLQAAAAACASAEVSVRSAYLTDLAPDHLAEQLEALGAEVDALAVVAAEHPLVTGAIARLAARGVPVLALGSPLSSPAAVGYVGLDSWKVGRTAAWCFDHLCRQPGRLGILVGTHRYRCHDLYESGFRSYFREHAGDCQLLDPVSTFESDAIAREMTEQLLARHADLRGLYVSGGGVGGVMAALRAAGQAGRIVTVCHDLLEATRAGLIDGTLSVVISHPFAAMGQAAVAALLQALSAAPDAPRTVGTVSVPMALYTRENL